MELKNLEEQGCSKRKEVRVDREGIARTRRGVRRWPAAVALLSVGVSYIALSGYVTFGPRAWLPGFMTVLLIPLLVAHAKGHYRLARGIGFVLLVVTTASVMLRVFFLVSTISARGASASSVLVDAILIWVSTVVTFAVWYWEIDGGGPAERRVQSDRHPCPFSKSQASNYGPVRSLLDSHRRACGVGTKRSLARRLSDVAITFRDPPFWRLC